MEPATRPTQIMKPLTLVCLAVLLIFARQLPAAEKPNVVYIMADELGYFEVGFMGGRNIKTPNLDRLAAEGMIFRNMLAGSPVCAPTRCNFLTGKHSGHASVRANGGGTPLRPDEATIASILKPLGYATGGFGKWGCGGRDSRVQARLVLAADPGRARRVRNLPSALRRAPGYRNHVNPPRAPDVHAPALGIRDPAYMVSP